MTAFAQPHESSIATIPPEDAPRRRGRPLAIRLFANPGTAIGVAIMLVVGACAIFAPWLAPYNPNLQALDHAAMPPSWLAGGSHVHVLGTDQLGRDVLSRIIWGARVSAIVALSVVIIGGTVGVTLGMIAGFAGGFIDDVISRIADVQLAFPFVLLAVAVVGILGPSLWTIILTLGITSWVQYVRIVRAETMSLRDREFVQAAVATGATTPRLIARHILPNIASSITVLATFEVARTVILESALSFLGLGVSPDTPSWGNMLSDGRQYLDTAWWMGLFPGIAIMLTVLGVNVFGDGLRDLLDPRTQ